MRLMLFTDGSALRPNLGGDGGWAFLITDASKQVHIRIQYEYVPNTTVSRMELSAVIRGLQYISSLHLHLTEVYIYTDSKYVKQYADFDVVQTWKYLSWTTTAGTPVKNRDLWEELDTVVELLKKRKVPVRFRKVKAHSGHPENEVVDGLAGKARKEQKKGYAQLRPL